MGSVPLSALVAAACLLAALAGGRAAAGEPAPSLRVVTVNLLHGAPVSGGRGHVAARLATALGLHWAHASATRRISGVGWLGGVLAELALPHAQAAR